MTPVPWGSLETVFSSSQKIPRNPLSSRTPEATLAEEVKAEVRKLRQEGPCLNDMFFHRYIQCIHDGLYYVYTWNPDDLDFWRSTPQNKASSNQNKGHLGSRYMLTPAPSRSPLVVNFVHAFVWDKMHIENSKKDCNRRRVADVP